MEVTLAAAHDKVQDDVQDDCGEAHARGDRNCALDRAGVHAKIRATVTSPIKAEIDGDLAHLITGTEQPRLGAGVLSILVEDAQRRTGGGDGESGVDDIDEPRDDGHELLQLHRRTYKTHDCDVCAGTLLVPFKHDADCLLQVAATGG